MTPDPGAYPPNRGARPPTPATRRLGRSSADPGRLDLEPQIAAQISLPGELVDAICERVLERLEQHKPSSSPWLTVAEAAEYMRCSRQRVYDLTASGRLPVAKDGARSLFHRDALDAYLTPPPVEGAR